MGTRHRSVALPTSIASPKNARASPYRFASLNPFLDRRSDVFRQPRTEHANAMPLGFRGPFVVRVLPRSLRGDGKNSELRAVVVPRLTLLRVCTDEADDRH